MKAIDAIREESNHNDSMNFEDIQTSYESVKATIYRKRAESLPKLPQT